VRHDGGTGGDRSTRARRIPIGSAALGLSTAVGLVVGLRAVAALAFPDLVPLLGLDPIPREGLGVEWSGQAVWPVELQAAALSQLFKALAALVLACAAVATLNTVIVLAEASSARRREFAVRSALGATPWVMVRALLGEIRTLTLAGVSLGIIAGVVAGAAARMTWPHALVTLTDAAPLELAVVVTGLLALTVAAHLGAAWQTTRSGRASAALRSGGRVGADPAAVFVRKTLSAIHVTTASTVLAVAVGLSSLPSTVATPSDTESPTVVIGATADDPTIWPSVLASLAAIPGMQAESLSAPGALVGLGVRDIVVTQCGRCVRGLFPAPLWSEIADHHSVAPGFFDLAGVDLVDGRGFTSVDAEGAPLVAIVNETLARIAFEKGEPIGRKIRLGSDYETWYTVVGITRNHAEVVPGADGVRRPAVYLSALQRPPAAAHVLLAGTDKALTAAAVIMSESGVNPLDAVPLAEYRAQQAVVLHWSSVLASFLGVLALLLATHGTWMTALQTTRRRSTELAIRRAVGAPDRAVLRFVLMERLRITGWGLAGFGFFGTMALAVINGVAGVPGPGPTAYAGISALLLVVALLASVRAATEALRVEPARLVE